MVLLNIRTGSGFAQKEVDTLGRLAHKQKAGVETVVSTPAMF
jgi:hypothetical protein